MKLRYKTMLVIVAIFSCLSMFCIGFANWSVGQGATSVTGMISAEEVSSYIELAPQGVKEFQFGPTGFTSGNDGPYKATMSISYIVHPANIYNHLSQNSVEITVSLGWVGSAPEKNLLSSAYISANVGVAPTVGDALQYESSDALQYESSDAKYDEGSGTYRVPLTLALDAGMTTDLTLTVTYTMDLTDMDTYKTYIFDPFGASLKQGPNTSASELGFKFSASIEGGAA